MEQTIQREPPGCARAQESPRRPGRPRFFFIALSIIAANTAACGQNRAYPSGSPLFCEADRDCDLDSYCDLNGGGLCRPVLASCGDDLVDEGEVCDDGNTLSGDGCRYDCRGAEACGDGLVDEGEVCDDGNTLSGDGCRSDCLGQEVCGDGLVDEGESCDDDNIISGDGCSDLCSREFGTPVQVASGASHTCALSEQDSVRCWGDGSGGKLGYANTLTIGENEAPSAAGDVDVGGPVTQIVTGSTHTCALLETGAVRCWGSAEMGQLGYANTDSIGDDEAPSTAGDVDVGGTVLQLAAGGLHTCALLDTGAVRCWGDASNGQLGYANAETIGDNEPPRAAGEVDVGGNAVQLAAGTSHTCALLDTGAVRCWGDGRHGRLGYANTDSIGDDEPPRAAGDVDVGGAVVQLAAGSVHTCALLDTGAVRCWGYSFHGALGYASNEKIGDDEPPSAAGDVAVGGLATQVSASGHTCALLESGELRCWGGGYHGQLGYGNTINIGDTEHPQVAGDVDVGGPALEVAAGAYHTCSILESGSIRCWGRAAQGQLGYGNTQNIGDDEAPASAGDVEL